MVLVMQGKFMKSFAKNYGGKTHKYQNGVGLRTLVDIEIAISEILRYRFGDIEIAIWLILSERWNQKGSSFGVLSRGELRICSHFLQCHCGRLYPCVVDDSSNCCTVWCCFSELFWVVH